MFFFLEISLFINKKYAEHSGYREDHVTKQRSIAWMVCMHSKLFNFCSCSLSPQFNFSSLIFVPELEKYFMSW